jgi:membrane associated rhomboid family serine protease
MRTIFFLFLSIYCIPNSSYAAFPVDPNIDVVIETDLDKKHVEEHASYGYISIVSAITSSLLYFTTELYIVAFSFGILAVIFGALGLNKKPKTLAIAGLFLGILEIVIPIFILITFLLIIDQVN